MKLNATQILILTELIRGLRYKEIAALHYLSESHIRKTVREAAKANNCQTTIQLAVKFREETREKSK